MKTEMTETSAGRIVYVRPLSADEIENLVSDEARDMLDSTDNLFALLDDEGQPLAVLQGREAAFALAHANSLTPVSVH